MKRSKPAAADAVYSHIGARIRRRRKALRLTQGALAECLGITYQQVQKYESGVTRLSAGALWQAAARLGVDVAYFFEGLPRAPSAREPSPLDLSEPAREWLGTAEGCAMANAFCTLDPCARASLMGVVDVLRRGQEPKEG